jgi:hypothetical protein
MRGLFFIALAALLACTSFSVAAAQCVGIPTGVPSAYRFYRAPGHGFSMVDDGQVVGELTPYVDLTVDYAYGPFALRDPASYTCTGPADGSRIFPVEHMVSTQLTGALAIGRRVQIGLNLPVVWGSGQGFQWDETSGGRPVPHSFPAGSAIALGDPRLHVLVDILDPEDTGMFGLAVAAWVTAPTGRYTASTPQRYLGDPTISVGGHIAASLHIEHLRVAANLGGAYHDEQTLVVAARTAEMTWGIAGSYDIGELVTVIAELTGGTNFGTVYGNQGPTEARVVGQLHFGDFTLHAGVGFGIAYAIGVPIVRAMIGGSWGMHAVRDSDGDGMADDVDGCPTEAEDADGHADEDGCPEDDDDGDHVSDANDHCPDQAEDMDGHDDDDGCPDEDDDHDGIPDGYDSCPNEPEDRDGDRDDDGCPDGDRDHDHILDTADRCPDEPEDTDGFGDEDGCPEEDFDQDGVPDTSDQCPDQAEDRDGFEDADGCPEEGAGRGRAHARGR